MCFASKDDSRIKNLLTNHLNCATIPNKEQATRHTLPPQVAQLIIKRANKMITEHQQPNTIQNKMYN